MRVLFLDSQGLFLDMVLRAMEDGHRCKWYIPQSAKTENIGRGLADIVPEWQPWMKWADLVILADNTRHLRGLEPFRKDGPLIIGATEESASWELDREKGQDVFAEAGIDVPDYKEFSKYDDAIAYVKKEMRRFVSKPCGDEPDKSLTYCAKSPADLVYMLERWKALKKMKSSFLLQEFIGGNEMAVGAWIGPHGFNKGWCQNWEFKRLMVGDLGPNTGELGTVLRYESACKLAKKVLEPLEDRLVDSGHTGYVDVNCIIDEHGDPWPLEWTMRFGWPTQQIQQPLHAGDSVVWLSDLAEGRDARQVKLHEICLGTVLAVPDFPWSLKPRADVVGTPIYHYKSDALHPCEMMQANCPQEVNGKIVTAPIMATAGDYVLVATGTGESVREARAKSLRELEKLSIPQSPFWRVDIGQRLKKQLPELQKHGYAEKMEF